MKPFENYFLCLDVNDNIVIAKQSVDAETNLLQSSSGNTFHVRQPIEIGHKLAMRSIAPREPVRKYGQVIGFASTEIQPGEWVHSHNLSAGELSLDYAFASEIPIQKTIDEKRTFLGYRRKNGKAATRNYIAVISTVNCSAATAKFVSDRFDEKLLCDYPNIDGILPLTHKSGCAFQYAGEDHAQLNRVMAGFAQHANIGAYLLIGLGCETGQVSFLTQSHHLTQLQIPGVEPEHVPLTMNIQDIGGVRKTVDYAVAALKELLPEANKVKREPIPVSELILGTECGGSDGNSGVTANPAVGIASDLLVAQGGTAVLGETPEIYGAEHLLTRRAISKEVGEKLIERIHWWEEYTGKFGVKIDNNPSVGNKQGGLTTIYEKSLGAVAKGGSSALREVYKYAEPIREKGFVVMDTPGYDPASVTGMVAGGANMIVFTTGRGSCFGCKPVPSIKVATNTPMYDRMIDDMDINAGTILEGESLETAGERIFEKILAVASGEKTKSERQGIGEEEFCPWSIGPVL